VAPRVRCGWVAVREALPLRHRSAGWPSAAGDALASVFLPANCRICETLLVRASRVPICEQCLASFTTMPVRICGICGQPLESFEPANGEPLHCPDCRPPTFAFTCARSLTIYEGAVVSALLTLKYERMEPLANGSLCGLQSLQDVRGSVSGRISWCPCHCIQRGNASGATTRRRFWPSRWRKPVGYRTARFCCSASGNAREKPFYPSKNAGRPFVARLPHVRAAKLTASASYW
jgi:hypothetical protein